MTSKRAALNPIIIPTMTFRFLPNQLIHYLIIRINLVLSCKDADFCIYSYLINSSI